MQNTTEINSYCMLLQTDWCKNKFRMSIPCKGIKKIYIFMRINNDVKNAYKNDGFILRHKLKAEAFLRKTEFFTNV